MRVRQRLRPGGRICDDELIDQRVGVAGNQNVQIIQTKDYVTKAGRERFLQLLGLPLVTVLSLSYSRLTCASRNPNSLAEPTIEATLRGA